MWGQFGEEPACRRGQLLDTTSQPISSHRRLHQAPDALDRVHLVRRVRGQPEYVDVWMGCQPLPDHLGGMRWRVVEV